MSDRPQTTRNRIMGILSTADAQIMFLDTPGIHKPLHKLGEYMNRQAEQALEQVDVACFVVDVTEKKGPGEAFILARLRQAKVPVLLVLNKSMPWKTRRSSCISLRPMRGKCPSRRSFP